MKNYLPEFSKEVFENPQQLDLHDELIDSHSINGLKQDISKEEFDKKFLSKIETPQLAYEYCKKYNIKNNPEMENLIIKDEWTAQLYSYEYARLVLKDRFESGEPIILKDKYFKELYKNFLKSKNIPIPPEFLVKLFFRDVSF